MRSSSLWSCVGFCRSSGSRSARFAILCVFVSSACQFVYLASGRKCPNASSLYSQARSCVFQTLNCWSVSPLTGSFLGGWFFATGIVILCCCTLHYVLYWIVLLYCIIYYVLYCTPRSTYCTVLYYCIVYLYVLYCTPRSIYCTVHCTTNCTVLYWFWSLF